MQQEQEDAAKLEALKRDVQVGLDQIDRGEYIDVADTEAFTKDFLKRIREGAIKRLGQPAKRKVG